MQNYEKKYYEKAKEKGGFDDGHRKYILNFIKERSSQETSILELGCGEGEFVNFFPEDFEYCGVDVSKFAIESAIKKSGGKKGNFFIMAEDSAKLPFEGGKFDFVFGVYSLEHFKKPKEMLGEAVRVLKPEGYLILLAPNLEFPLSYINAIRHRSFLYKTWLKAMRVLDYFMRILGRSRFRTLEENFTSATGKYERLDDDLAYIVSSYEVINYLKIKQRMKEVFSAKIVKEEAGSGIKGFARRIIALLPAMKYYGNVLFVVMQK